MAACQPYKELPVYKWPILNEENGLFTYHSRTSENIINLQFLICFFVKKLTLLLFRFISATLAYTRPFVGELIVFEPWNLELVMSEFWLRVSVSFCFWNNSSNAVWFNRVETGRCRIEAVLGGTGVEVAVPTGVDWCIDSAELDLVMSSVSSFSPPEKMQTKLYFAHG